MRRWLNKHLPKPSFFTEKLANYPRLATKLADPNLWKLNRRSASRGVAVGLFVTFVPIPFQLIMSALAAVLCRANLPIAVILSVINNPFTFVPINYFIYRLGKKVFLEDFHSNGFTHFSWQLQTFQSAWDSFKLWLPQFGKEYFIGLFIVTFGSAIIGYVLTDLIWRIEVNIRLYIRNKKRKKLL